ncbi:MAG: MFS transporter [Bacilli bacterium]
MRSFLWTAGAMYFVVGLATVLVGSVLPQVISYYHVSYTVGGQLVFAQFIGFMAGVPAASLLMRRIEYRTLLALAGLFICVALCGIALLPQVFIVALLFVANGFGIALSETAIATLIMERFVGRRAVVMSYLEVAFGLGAVCMPAVASLFIVIHAWRFSFLFAGLLALLSSIGWLTMTGAAKEAHDFATAEPLDAASLASAVTGRGARRALLFLFLLMTLLYVGIESSLNSFLPALFIPYLHVRSYVASLSVTTFWAAMVIGRTVAGWVVRKVSYAPFLFWSIAAAIVVLAAMTLWSSAVFCFSLIFVVGLAMSGVYSVTMVYANHVLPGATRIVTGLITAFAGIGGAVLPAVTGYAMDHTSPAGVIDLIAGSTFLLLVTLSVILLSERASRKAFDDRVSA